MKYGGTTVYMVRIKKKQPARFFAVAWGYFDLNRGLIDLSQPIQWNISNLSVMDSSETLQCQFKGRVVFCNVWDLRKEGLANPYGVASSVYYKQWCS